MGNPKLTLYVDIVSPFAYMGYWMLRNHRAFQQAEITYVPVLLGGIMKTTGNTAPLFIKNKDKWINIERLRWAKQFSIPLRAQVPPNFPINTVSVGRLLAAIEMKHPDKLIPALDRLYTAFWSPETLSNPPSDLDATGDPRIKTPEDLARLIEPVFGSDTEKLCKSIADQDVKDRLSKNTEQALKDGAFGLPWFQCTNAQGESEGFWGFDHLGQVLQHLGLDRAGDEKMRALL